MRPHVQQDPKSHLAPTEVRRRIVRAIVRSAREEAGLPVRERDPRAALTKRQRSWRRRVLPLF
jgi:hypothetical protein